MAEVKPCCYDCLSEDVAVKVIDQLGFEHWFCAEDWAAQQEFHERIMTMLDTACRELTASAEDAFLGPVEGLKPLGLGPLLGK